MRWQKISLSIPTAMLLAWTAFSATAADVETDKSLVVASAKIEEERDLTAAELLARSQEFNETCEASVLSGFQPGQADANPEIGGALGIAGQPFFTRVPSLLRGVAV